jgi:3-methyladenine DNA glycosylase AlkC
MTAKRKTYSRRADVPPALRRDLNEGRDEARTLAEVLTVDLAELLRHAVPDMSAAAVREMKKAAGLGWIARTRMAGELILAEKGLDVLPHILAHRSDQVRGWGAVMIAGEKKLTLKKRLSLVRPLADDANPGTRETVWIMLRPKIAEDLEASFALLRPWAKDKAVNIRRYAIEITRPRGVWCAHIASLRDDPSPGLPLLNACYADPARYVQNSVANWLNDAAKDNPGFVRRVVKDWKKKSDSPATAYICKRALRSL